MVYRNNSIRDRLKTATNLVEGIVQGLKEVKDIQSGKLPRQTYTEFKMKIKKEQLILELLF